MALYRRSLKTGRRLLGMTMDPVVVTRVTVTKVDGVADREVVDMAGDPEAEAAVVDTRAAVVDVGELAWSSFYYPVDMHSAGVS